MSFGGFFSYNILVVFKSLINKTALLVAARFGSRVMTAVFALWLARRLGPAQFGQFIFITSFIYIFIPVADLGIENYLLRVIPRWPNRRVKILRRLFYPRVIASLFAYSLAILAALIGGYSLLDVGEIAAFGLMLVPYSLSYFFQTYFNAQGKTNKAILIKLSYPLLYLFTAFIFVISGGGYRHVYWSITLSLFFTVGILLKHYPQVWWPVRLSWRRFNRVWRRTWPYAILTVLAVFYLKVDVIMLKRLEGEGITGLYGPVSNLIQTAILIPQSLAVVLFPISSRLVAKDKTQMKRLYWRMLMILLLVSLPLAVAGFVMADWGVNFLLGSEYLGSIPALKLACLSLVFFFVNSFAGNVIQNSRRVKSFVPWAASNVVVNIGLNLFLIPQFSLVGAVLAKIGSELYGFAINNYWVAKVLNEK